MTMSCLRNALAAMLVILGLGSPRAAAQATFTKAGRPVLTSLTLTLDDGRAYSLTPQQLADPRGGAIFWGDWAVANLLVPSHRFRADVRAQAEDVMALWASSGHSGQLPAFLVNTAAGPVNPLDPGGPQPNAWGPGSRPAVTAITVGYADGRVLSLGRRILRDRRSGVLVWNDFAVANLFMPFYLMSPGLPTHPEDVMRTWNTPTAAPTLSGQVETPAFLVKPECIPQYMER